MDIHMPERAFNAADEQQVRDRKRTAKDAIEVQREDLKALLDQPAFRRFIWRHLHVTCGIMQSPGSTNGTLQSMQIGKQDVGRALWAEIEGVDPLVIPLMMGEHYQERQ
jgi:hypothetical protein